MGISDLNSNLPQAREGRQAVRARVNIVKLFSNDSCAAVWVSDNPLAEVFGDLWSCSSFAIISINDFEKITFLSAHLQRG